MSKLKEYYERRGENYLDRPQTHFEPPKEPVKVVKKRMKNRQISELPWFPRWIRETSIRTGMCGPAVYNSLLYFVDNAFVKITQETCTQLSREPWHLWDRMRDNWGYCFDDLGGKKCQGCKYRQYALRTIQLFGTIKENRERIKKIYG